MYTYNRKKEIIKNVIYVGFILLLAVISTYYIYHKFEDKRSVDVNSDSLDITFHESTGEKVSILKVTPVTDSVGLTSKSYNITIKNNLTEKVDYKVLLLDDLEEYVSDMCEERQIPSEDIRVSVKSRGDNKITSLNEIENHLLVEDTIEALEKVEVSVRLWVKKESIIPMGSDMHYHGKLKVTEIKHVYSEEE